MVERQSKQPPRRPLGAASIRQRRWRLGRKKGGVQTSRCIPVPSLGRRSKSNGYVATGSDGRLRDIDVTSGA